MQLVNERRKRIVLAAMAAVPGAEFAPVQIQKFFFLLDENVASKIEGKLFAFSPYDYGPFDKAVYTELEILKQNGLVNIVNKGSSAGQRRYLLTPEGQKLGETELAKLERSVQSYMGEVSNWVRSLPFESLVGAIYKAYPDMRKNSIFQD